MAVSLAVLALAGCGDDEPAARATATAAPPTVPMSAPPETFIRNVNEICSALHEQLDAVPHPASLQQVPGVAVKEIAIRRAAIDRLAALDAPAVLRAEAAALARDLRAQQRRARAVERAAEADDGERLRAIEHEGAVAAAHERKRATAAGFSECAVR